MWSIFRAFCIWLLGVLNGGERLDRTKEFMQYQVDNPHNVLFKSIVGYEDREDTIKGLKKLLSSTQNMAWISCKDNPPPDDVEVLLKAMLDGRKYVGYKHTYIYHDGEKKTEYHFVTARGSTRMGLKPIAWMPLPE